VECKRGDIPNLDDESEKKAGREKREKLEGRWDWRHNTVRETLQSWQGSLARNTKKSLGADT